ncbi:MAG: phosphatidylserine/phosphatidylglycerophosphate/cardiolipin synthase family protein [Gemmataceae bacterium]
MSLLLYALVGCQMPSARPAACGSFPVTRTGRFTSQVIVDTTVAAATRPGRAAYVLATEPAAYARAWIDGLCEKRIGLTIHGPPGPINPSRSPLDAAALEAESERISGESAVPGDMRLMLDGIDALTALDRVIDRATRRIDVLMYLWGDDEIGWHVARKLSSRAGPNLRIRVCVDGGGNLTQGEPRSASANEVNRAVCWLARQPYVELLRTRNPAARLDHRKLVVVDGQVAWNGGRNFVASAFRTDHDLSYTVSGVLAARMATVFEEFWQREGGVAGEPLPPPMPPLEPNLVARIVRTRPTHHHLSEQIYLAVKRASHHVYVENPYFSDNHLIAELAAARRRGADVRVVLTLHSGSDLYDHANRAVANRLLRAGIRVYLHPSVTHVKAMAIDGVWAYAGTGNFDNLSLRHNRELGLAIVGGPVLDTIERELFQPDFCPEWELTVPLPLTATDYWAEVAASAVS